MTMRRHFDSDHDHAQQLLPWWVNGRLPPTEAAQVESHVQGCRECRADVDREREILGLMRRSSSVEYAPQASFQKLWSRIEELGTEGSLRQEQGLAALDSTRWRLAATMVLGIALGALAMAAWNFRTPAMQGEYQTVTQAEDELAARAAVRAVFSGQATVDELTRIVRAAGLTIVSGPSESGVYSLALTRPTEQDVSAAVARLRQDPRVRFAEPVGPGASSLE